MKKIKAYIKVFTLLLLSVGNSLFAVPDSMVYRIKLKSGVNASFNGTSIHINMDSENAGFWYFSPEDNYKFALRSYNDNKWKRLSSDFDAEEDTIFKSIGWFRLHYKFSKEMLDQGITVNFSHDGASEVFNDGKLLVFYGRVSDKQTDEVCFNPSKKFIPLSIHDTLEHVLAVRYSNAHKKLYLDNFDETEAGFKLRLFRQQDLPLIQVTQEYQEYFFIGLSAFLFALSLVHLMIFLFERSRRFNLYHSLFVLTLALLFFCQVLNKITETPLINFRISYYSEFLVPSFFISIIALLFNLFQKKRNKFFYLCLVIYVISLAVHFIFNSEIAGVFYAILFFMMYFGSMVISIKAIRQNFRGAKIVGFGVLATTIFMILSIVSLIVFQRGAIALALLLAIVSVLSLPFSMSIYLAFDFAKANETLKKQITQIEGLSERAIKEEQEKKQILENQNQMLETQVKQRTSEITAQKEIIEEKNKDITDSINYAKRIQDATLASKEIKYKLFPNAFVLFKPKDIVSGDFYWFAGKNGKRLISVCDCTGHGVPGALMSMIGNNLLNKVVNEKAITSPDKILIELDEELRLTLKKEENTDSKDGMDVALLSFSNERDMDYAGANRPLWIVREGQLEEIKATKISIGGDRYGEAPQFKCHSIKLKEGDTVYISSDGFADQFNNEDKKLMTRRFKEILLSIQHLSMSEQETYLNDFIEKWKGNLEQTDDILVIGIRV